MRMKEKIWQTLAIQLLKLKVINMIIKMLPTQLKALMRKKNKI